MLSHDMLARARTRPLAATSRFRNPRERRSLSRSATRALDVLEQLASAQRPLRAVEIAGALQLHRSTTDQLLKTMVDSAHLLFDARTKSYWPSPRLAGFGAVIAEDYRGSRLRTLIADVHARTGTTVTLTAQHDVHMQVLDFIQGDDVHRNTVRGLRIPLFGSAVGGALLSTQSDAEVARGMRRARVSAADQAELKDAIVRIRAAGYACGGISPDGSSWSLAMALPPMPRGITLVLGLSAPAGEIEAKREALVATMRDAIATHLSTLDNAATEHP